MIKRIAQGNQLSSAHRKPFRVALITSSVCGLVALLALLTAYWQFGFKTDNPMEAIAIIGLFVVGASVGPFLFLACDDNLSLFHRKNRARMYVGLLVATVLVWLTVFYVNYDGEKWLAMRVYTSTRLGMSQKDVEGLMRDNSAKGDANNRHGFWSFGERFHMAVDFDREGKVARKVVSEIRTGQTIPNRSLAARSIQRWLGISEERVHLSEP